MDSIKLKDIVSKSITKGTTPNTIGFSLLDEGEIKFYKIENLKNGKIESKKALYITNECNKKMTRSELKENDILFSIAGTLGETAIVKKENLPANINQALAIVRLKDEISFEYVNYQLNNIKKKIKEGSNKGVISNLNLSILENIEIYFPKDVIQNSIVKKLNFFKNNINDIKTLLEKIEIRNQYYADKLLSGELRINEKDGLISIRNESINDYIYKKEKISNIAKITTGKKNANEGSINGKYEFFTCSIENKKIDNYSFDQEAILISGNGDPGVCKYYNGKFDAYQRVYILSDFTIKAKYLYLIMNRYFKDSIQNSKIGGVIQYIKLNDITDFEFVLPNEKDISLISDFLTKLEDEKQKVQRLLELEEKRFEWLSDKLLSGEYIIED